MLKLMYITNNPQVAQIAENAGVDRIFVDLEYIGKADRQKGMDTVQSKHTLDDIKMIRSALISADLLVRINPIHEETEEYCSTEREIGIAIENGADILMLPYFKSVQEVRRFIKYVDGRVKTMLLLETPQAVENIDKILDIEGIDYIHIGLNDLSLGYGKKFMFELLADGTVEKICNKIFSKGIEYGFGGIAGLGQGILPAERIIVEHYRLHSSATILSRSFCNTNIITDLDEIEQIFNEGVKKIRIFEKQSVVNMAKSEENLKQIQRIVQQICEGR